MLLASNDELMEQYLTDASGFTAGGFLRESIEDRARAVVTCMRLPTTTTRRPGTREISGQMIFRNEIGNTQHA